MFRNIGIICRRELRSYLSSPMAYIVTAVFLALSGTFFATYLVGTNYSDTSIRGFLNSAPFLLLFFSAVLTMRTIAEERKTGTWELLLTVPARNMEIVLGKYAGSLIVLTGMLICTLYYPLLLSFFGDPDIGPIVTSYLGLFLLGSASTAVGIFASSLSANQIVSAVIAGGLLFALWFLGPVAELVAGPIGQILTHLSLSSHFPSFARGIMDTRAIVYYLSVTAIFLYVTVRSAEVDRWR